jgi:hypothetical protein
MPRYPIIALCSTEILRAIAMEDGCRSLIGCKTEEKGKSLTQYHKQKKMEPRAHETVKKW